jgi:repressor LexA
MYPTLTKKQKDILEYIKVYSQMHGYSPSLEEIKGQFRLSAISTVHEHIQNLKKKGYIHNEINQARSIRPIDPNLKDRDFVEIPIVYNLSKNETLEVNKNQRTITVAKEMLAKDGTYLGLVVETNAYKEVGILAGDLMILKEAPDIRYSATIIATAKNNKAYILKTNATGKIEPLLQEHQGIKNLCIKAVICDLVRKYS